MVRPPHADGSALSLSVVIPVWNGRAYLAKCLEALAASLRPADEIVVVDDGSDDDSVAVARAHGCKVVSLTEGPLGPATARNRGVDATAGEIIIFIDCDVAVHPETLGEIERELLANPDASGLFGSYDDRPTEHGLISGYRNLMHHYVHQQSEREAATFWAGCGAIRRETFVWARGFDETYRWASIEDIELGSRLHRAGARLLLCPEIQATHCKRWSFWQMVQTDIFRRAIPWTKLLLTQDSLPNDLNLRTENRVSALAVWLLVLLSGVALTTTPWLLGLTLFPILVLLGCNHGLYRLFRRQRGFFFSLGGILLHWLHYLYSSATFGLIVLEAAIRSARSTRGLEGEAPARVVVARD